MTGTPRAGNGLSLTHRDRRRGRGAAHDLRKGYPRARAALGVQRRLLSRGRAKHNIEHRIAIRFLEQELRKALAHRVQVAPLVRDGRLGPPRDAGGHKLILLPVAEVVAAAQLGLRVDAELIVRADVDGIGDVVTPAARAILGDRVTATLVLEHVSIDDCLVRRVSANLDRKAVLGDRDPRVAADVEDCVAFDDHGFSRRPALPVVAAVPPVAVTVHVDLVGLKAHGTHQ
jgi:hypothetical protein